MTTPNHGRTYTGTRTPQGCVVTRSHHRQGRGVGRLPPRFSLRNHSPDGYEWGYGGSGPAQLALALLMDATGDSGTALRLYQDYKWHIVAALPHDGWTLNQAEILAWVADRPSTLIV